MIKAAVRGPNPDHYLALTFGSSSERLALTLQLWHLATSVLQRAHRAVASSYIELDRLDRRESCNNAPGALPILIPPHPLELHVAF